MPRIPSFLRHASHATLILRWVNIRNKKGQKNREKGKMGEWNCKRKSGEKGEKVSIGTQDHSKRTGRESDTSGVVPKHLPLGNAIMPTKRVASYCSFHLPRSGAPHLAARAADFQAIRCQHRTTAPRIPVSKFREECPAER